MKFVTVKTILHSKSDCHASHIKKEGEIMKCNNCGEEQKEYPFAEVNAYWEAKNANHY